MNRTPSPVRTPPSAPDPWLGGPARPARVARRLLDTFGRGPAGGVLLLAATAAALLWATLDAAGYARFWAHELSLSLAGVEWSHDLTHLVNDGLMAIFFLLVGLEVKRELTVGELATRRAAMLPFCAAVGGMVVPALAYLLLSGGGEAARGWGIPMATDVAFALAALAALGRRVPVALVAFLLGLAVIDDIGAILVVALVYSDGVALGWLAAAALGIVAMWAMRRLTVRAMAPYLVVGVAVWLATLQSGVHATIAAVAIGLITPVHPQVDRRAAAEQIRAAARGVLRRGGAADLRDLEGWRRPSRLARWARSPLERVAGACQPWSALVVLPLFALANAGIPLRADDLRAAAEQPVAVAVAVALVVGKTAGIALGCLVAVRLGLSRLPPGVRPAHIVGVGALGGIGFTVSLFIAELAFADPGLAAAAKLGVLSGSLVAAAAGLILLRWAGAPRRGRRSGPAAVPPAG